MVVPAEVAAPVAQPEPVQAPVVVAEAVATPEAVVETAPVAPIEAAAVNPEIEQKPEVVAEVVEPVAATEETAVATPVTMTPSVVETATPVVSEPAPVALVDLAATLADSGLVMVQTTSAAPMVAVAEPAPKLGRARKPKAVVAGSDEPLVMVETGNK